MAAFLQEHGGVDGHWWVAAKFLILQNIACKTENKEFKKTDCPSHVADLMFKQIKSMDILLTCSHYVTQSAQVMKRQDDKMRIG